MKTTQSKPLNIALLPIVLGAAIVLMDPTAYSDSRDDGYEDIIEVQLPFDSGASLILSNQNGSVKIGSWDKEEIKIVAEKRMRIERFGSWFLRLLGFKTPKIETDEEARVYLDQFTFEISGEADGMEIKTVRPSVSSVNLQFTMTYEILLPRNADVSVEVTNGKITIRDIHGEVGAETTNGSITLEEVSGNLYARTTNGSVKCEDISGGLRVRTVNGGIDVSFAEDAFVTDDINCRTTNGNLRVSIPADSEFELAARTSSGKIVSDFQLSSVTEESKKRLEGTVGNGGPTITLRNTNGSIELEAID